jgi:D-tyrosyl-tRNA(Tyr) deacylase
MKVVVQRVGKTSLSVDGKEVSSIPFGLAVYFGVKVGDTPEMAKAIAKKIVSMRIFCDDNDKMNLSVKDVGGEILLISQFTLYGDCSHGNRPSFTQAECPNEANALYQYCAECLRVFDVPVRLGVFGADMKISQFNDGPVTIIYEI